MITTWSYIIRLIIQISLKDNFPLKQIIKSIVAFLTCKIKTHVITSIKAGKEEMEINGTVIITFSY